MDSSRAVRTESSRISAFDPIVGTTIGGRYLVVERIGIGGMGTVYRATQTGLSRDVAIKVLKQELAWDPNTVARFHREAHAMSLLVHPNTIRVFDFGQTSNGLLYLVMELLEGEPLTRRLQRLGVLELSDAVVIAKQVLRSLAEAHSKGIIHRDLKPDNIFLSVVGGQDKPLVKVLDFGIAKIVQGERKVDQLETQAGTVFGTPRYMSPEQAQGKVLDPRSDLYTVGTLLYQMLVGRPPFVDNDAVVVMAKHIRERPMSPRAAVRERTVPESLDRVVMRAVAKNPAHRFKSAESFIRALDACLPDVLATERNGSTGSWLREVPGLSIAFGGAILGLAIGTAVYLMSLQTHESASAEDVDMSSPVAMRPSAFLRPDETHNTDAAFLAEAAPEPAAPVTARALLASAPNGAEVWHGETLLGHTPLSLLLPAGQRMRVELRKDGYVPVTTELIADDKTRSSVLTSRERPAERKTRVRSRAPRRAVRRESRPSNLGNETLRTPRPPSAEPVRRSPQGAGDPYEAFD